MRSGAAPDVGPAPHRLTARRGAAAFLLTAVTLATWVWASWRWFDPAPASLPTPRFPGSIWLGGWVRFDAGWYRDIAEFGYSLVPGQQSNVAFFPAYPLAMRALGPLAGHVYTAGIAVTFASGLLAAVLFTRWCRDRLEPRAQVNAVALLLLFPYAWYLVGAVYADALFLAASLGAFALVERDRPVLAGLVGAVASAARPVGIAVVVGLALVTLERREALRVRTVGRRWSVPTGIAWRNLRGADAGVLLSALGFGSFSAYLWVRWGDPLLFSTVQQHWGQDAEPATWFKIDLLALIVRHPTDELRYITGALFQGGLVLAAVAVLPRLTSRFGWGYGSYVAAALALPIIGSKDFQGMGRYLLAAFPVFALWGEQLTRRSRAFRWAVLAGSAAAAVVWSHLFARGFYVA